VLCRRGGVDVYLHSGFCRSTRRNNPDGIVIFIIMSHWCFTFMSCPLCDMQVSSGRSSTQIILRFSWFFSRQANSGILPQIRPPTLSMYYSIILSVSRYSAVGIATSDPGGVKNFHFSMSYRLVLGSTQTPIQWVPGALSSGVKRPGREFDHSPPASSEVKRMWIYTSTPPYNFVV
jgi:hypothetical protein